MKRLPKNTRTTDSPRTAESAELLFSRVPRPAAFALLCLGILINGLFGLHAQEREGNFTIRFEPTAKLQTGTQVPFQITVKDALRKPLPHAQVTLQIEDKDGANVQQFPAPEVQAGTYIAKPVFRAAGDWTVYVQVRREGATSARSIQFQVSE